MSMYFISITISDNIIGPSQDDTVNILTNKLDLSNIEPWKIDGPKGMSLRT